MPRYNLRKLSPQYQKAVLNEFYRAILSLKSKSEAEKFFNELFDLNETAMFARRVIAAEMLANGDTYREINEFLKMGMDTIAKIDKKFKDGSGYKLIVNRLKRKDKNNK